VDYHFVKLEDKKSSFWNIDISKLTIIILKKKLNEYCCMSGISQLTLSANGMFYPCPKFAGLNKKIGDAKSDEIDHEVMKELIYDDKRDSCQKCWMKNFCSTYCYATKYRNTDQREVISIRCTHMELLTENIIRNILRIKSKGNLLEVANKMQRLFRAVG